MLICAAGKQGEYIRFLVLAENAVGLSEESAVLVAQACRLGTKSSYLASEKSTKTFLGPDTFR